MGTIKEIQSSINTKVFDYGKGAFVFTVTDLNERYTLIGINSQPSMQYLESIKCENGWRVCSRDFAGIDKSIMVVYIKRAKNPPDFEMFVFENGDHKKDVVNALCHAGERFEKKASAKLLN